MLDLVVAGKESAASPFKVEETGTEERIVHILNEATQALGKDQKPSSPSDQVFKERPKSSPTRNHVDEDDKASSDYMERAMASGINFNKRSEEEIRMALTIYQQELTKLTAAQQEYEKHLFLNSAKDMSEFKLGVQDLSLPKGDDESVMNGMDRTVKGVNESDVLPDRRGSNGSQGPGLILPGVPQKFTQSKSSLSLQSSKPSYNIDNEKSIMILVIERQLII
jgi:hypothetical protein